MLNNILQNITSDNDWKILADLCEYNGEFTLDELTQAGKKKAIKKKIATNFSLSNLKNIYNSDVYYDQLLLSVAKKIEISPIPKALCSIKDFETIEQLILGKYIKSMKDTCIKEKGYSFWEEKEKTAFGNIEKLSNKLMLTENEKHEIHDFQNDFDNNLMTKKVSSLVFFLVVRELIDLKNINGKEGIADTINYYSKFLILGNPLFLLASVIAKEIKKWKATTNTVLFLTILHIKQINADRLNKILE